MIGLKKNVLDVNLIKLVFDVQFAVCYNKQKEVRKMNSKQRAKLENIISAIEDIVSDEQEKLDNMEENFSGTERYEKIEEGISALEEAIENIQTAIDD